jgi:deoxyribodipyrimidine photo-lyase
MAFPPGEAEALRRLRVFSRPDGPIAGYAMGRDRLDLEATSALSPYLRFGMLSPRAAVQAARMAMQQAPDPESRRGAETWLNELIWREFYLHLLDHFPQARRENFRPLQVDWRHDPSGLAAWKAGETGYPVVDAAMRQLSSTGWMHNRARMIAASFLTKDLLVDWREGETSFMQHLLDGDPAANNGGWQWTAGTGADAAPYFRIFNPVLQSQKFDPQGDYIRRWLPQLARVPLAFLHAPWGMQPQVQRESGCRLGIDYPSPIVDHAQARPRALAAYHRAS